MSSSSHQIAQAMEAFQAENAKFEAGNKAAGTRARKALMDLKKLCDVRRKEIQSEKNAE
jgi:hypothetical protein